MQSVSLDRLLGNAPPELYLHRAQADTLPQNGKDKERKVRERELLKKRSGSLARLARLAFTSCETCEVRDDSIEVGRGYRSAGAGFTKYSGRLHTREAYYWHTSC